MAEVEVSPGVVKKVLKDAPSTAKSVQRGNNITVHCTGYLKSDMSKPFWSTRNPSNTFTFQVGVGGVIKGWDEGCVTMKLGEEARFTLSAEKGYGQRGFSAWGIPPNAPLVFDIEIVSIS